MRTMTILVALCAFTTVAQAQSNSKAAPTPNSPPVDCRGDARAKGLRGQERRDAVLMCAVERRVACAKEAIARKIVGPERKDFLRACAGRPDRGDSKDND